MWSPIYQNEVLRPDYEYAAQHLKAYFLDAMTAHLRTVAKLTEPPVPDRHEKIALLERALADIREQDLPVYSPDREDFYFTIQGQLEALLGIQTVSLLRLGLSRNDLDMTVYRLHARDALLRITRKLCDLRRSILELAQQHTETIIIAYTHHQPAQPTSLAHYFTAIESSLHRDYGRMRGALERLNQSPMGAAALAGSSHKLDRHYTASLLGFDSPMENTYDAVSASDWQVELAACIQTASLTLSRFLYDLLYWASQGRLTLENGLVQGSSIMPQKRNPVALEHARARFSKATGHALAVLFSSHNIPYGDLNDPGPDVQATLALITSEFLSGVELLTACIKGCHIHKDVWEAEARASDSTATELADVLTQHYSLPFQEAHRSVANLVRLLKEEKRPLTEATPDDLVRTGGPSVEANVLRNALEAAAFIDRRAGYGGPNPEIIKGHIHSVTKRLDADCQQVTSLRKKFEQVRNDLSAPRKEQA